MLEGGIRGYVPERGIGGKGSVLGEGGYVLGEWIGGVCAGGGDLCASKGIGGVNFC